MNKLRTLPVYIVHDTDFLVDVEKQVLREAERPANEISFVRDMTDQGDHYLLRFDTVEKTPQPDRHDQWVETIAIPPMVQLDPEGMAAIYGVHVDQLTGKTDFEIIVDQQALALRQQGALPKIELAGEAFIIDLRLHELRHAANFHPVISLKSFDLTGDGWHYEAFYHPVMKQVVELDPRLLEFPEGVIKLKIPNELGLDPVATAREYGMDERELLRRHPIQRDLKAEVIPLSETYIPALIQRNKEALQQEHRENAQKLKARNRPKF
jgi:hypothetical protein